MAITNARIQVRRGLEKDFNPDEMTPGEWALSTDTKYIRMCIYPGLCLRMATYEAFEEDMKQIQSIVSEARTIQEAINRINTEVSSNAQAVAEYTVQAKQYRDEAKQFRDEASALANVGIATETVPGLMAGGDNAISEDGKLLLTKTTTDRTLLKSHAGGLKVNRMDGESRQDGTPTPDAPIEIKSVEVSEIKAVGKNLLKNTAITTTSNGITFTVNDDGSVTVNSDGSYTSSNTPLQIAGGNYAAAIPLPDWLELGKSYIISDGVGATDNTQPRVFIQLYATDENVQYFNQKFTVPDNALYYSIRLVVPAGTVLNNVTFYPMIRLADIDDDTYEPYQEKTITLSKPVTLRGIGDVKDVLRKQDGVYGVLRDIGEDIFDGSIDEAWYNDSSAGQYCRFFVPSASITKKSGRNVCLCNRAIYTNDTTLNKAGVCFVGGNNFCFYPSQSFTTVSDYKTWLASNNVKVQYLLDEPIFEPLPLADQIALHELETFDTVTYISTDSEIEPIIEVEYGTSKVGAYALKGMLTAEANALQIAQLNTLTNELATQLVAGNEV